MTNIDYNINMINFNYESIYFSYFVEYMVNTCAAIFNNIYVIAIYIVLNVT